MTDKPTPATVAASALTSDKTHLPGGYLSRVSPKTRQKAADRGEAMEDGSFPIRDGQDLKRAIAAFGRAKDKARAKRHIIKRARALDKINLLPESWRVTASRELKPRDPQPQADPLTAGAVPAHVLNVLEQKVAVHNAANPTRTLSVAKAACVFRRGCTAYTTQPKQGVTVEQYAQARVNAFLHLLSTGEPRNPAYVDDNDLLPGPPPFARSLVARGDDFKEWQHPRGRDGEWIDKHGIVKIFKHHTSTDGARTGEVVDTQPDGVHVRMDDTGEVEVHPADVIEHSEGKARLHTDGGDGPKFSEYPAGTLPHEDEVVIVLGKDLKPVATGRVVHAINDQIEVRIESSDSDEMGSILGVGQMEERGMNQIRKPDDPAFRFGPDISPLPAEDRPENFPAELLNERTDRLVAGEVDGWTPAQKFEEGINSSNILSNGDRTVFVKSVSENGVGGARSEVDAARMFRRAGLDAPHVERGGHDGILVVSEMSGRDKGLHDVDQWDNVFDGFSQKVSMDDLELKDPDQIWKMGAMNMVLGNADRHGGNMLFARDDDDKGYLLPIDHEISLDSSGGGELPAPDGSDLDWHVNDLSFAYDYALMDYMENLNDDDAFKVRLRDFLTEQRNNMLTQPWESDGNRNVAVARIDAMLANLDAVVQRMHRG